MFCPVSFGVLFCSLVAHNDDSVLSYMITSDNTMNLCEIGLFHIVEVFLKVPVIIIMIW